MNTKKALLGALFYSTIQSFHPASAMEVQKNPNILKQSVDYLLGDNNGKVVTYPMVSEILEIAPFHADQLKPTKVAVIDSKFFNLNPAYRENLSSFTLNQTNSISDKDYKLFTHGTFVTNEIGGNHGIAPNTELTLIPIAQYGEDFIKMETKISSFLDLKLDPLVVAINDAIEQKVDFINISRHLANPDNPDEEISEDVKIAFQRAAEAGIGIIKSAGNDGEVIGQSNYTKSLGNLANTLNGHMILVGNMEYVANNGLLIREQQSSQSNKAGLAADHYLCAPGTDLKIKLFNKPYYELSGTSYAAPIVTGAASLLKGMYPHLSNKDVLQLLLWSARRNPLHNTNEDFNPQIYGHGVVNLKNAITLIQN